MQGCLLIVSEGVSCCPNVLNLAKLFSLVQVQNQSFGPKQNTKFTVNTTTTTTTLNFLENSRQSRRLIYSKGSHQPTTQHHKLLNLIQVAGLIQGPKSFQAEHFRLKSCYLYKKCLHFKFSYHFVVDKVMRKPRFRWDYWKFLAVMTKNAEQSMTMVYLLLRFYPSFLSKLDLIISSFLIQNKLSNEWSTFLVV